MRLQKRTAFVSTCNGTFVLFFPSPPSPPHPSGGLIGCSVPLGTFGRTLGQDHCRVLGGDKTLNVLSRLFRNVGEELNDPYALFHMAQLSEPLGSHPKPKCFIRAGRTRRLPGRGGGWCGDGASVNHGWITHGNQQRAGTPLRP